MGLLLGLPLRLLGLIFGLLRLALPIALIVLVVWLWRHRKPSGSTAPKKDEPSFHGPVYTVDYKDVKDENE